MHFRKLLLVVIAVAVVTFSAGLRGQGLVNGIRVNLPEAVTVGDKVLQPGEYEIRRPSATNRDIIQIFNKDKMVYETNVLTVASGPDAKEPKETKVVLQHIGNAFYFDKIWMEDRDYGWEFPLPERVRALQRETAVNIPARYESLQASTPDQLAEVEPHEGLGLSDQLDLAAAQNERDQAKAEQDRQAQLDRERQAQLDRENEERNRVAALQPEPPPVTPQSDARVTEPQSSIQQTETPEQLPETATNWLALVLGGGVLVTLSYLVRPARAQG